MSDAQAAMDLLIARLEAGAAVEVNVVELDVGFRVAWGVEGGPHFSFTHENARKLAEDFDAKGYLPNVAEWLRTAADLCQRHASVLQ